MIILRQKTFGAIKDYLNAKKAINKYKETAEKAREGVSGTITRDADAIRHSGKLSLDYGKKNGKYAFKKSFGGVISVDAAKELDEKLVSDAIKHNKKVLVKRSAPWVAGGAVVAGATAAGIHAYKKHKKDKDKKDK